MVLGRWLKRGPARLAGERLYAAAVALARRPVLYAELGAPDTADGRFEVYTLHVLLVLARLQGEGRRAAGVGQALFDAYVSGLDHGLRELAVGDLAVGKTMRKLGEAFYGRGRALDEALAALPDRGPLEALIGRTVLGEAPGAQAGLLVDDALALRARLAATPTEQLLAGQIDPAAF
ncbi:MAG TPA: ubiquinol-cytochrome C chaperone family protein [Caulobacteraceae bacterium]|jgi:cytochrome b pre-mRNA-processing protein 3